MYEIKFISGIQYGGMMIPNAENMEGLSVGERMIQNSFVVSHNILKTIPKRC